MTARERLGKRVFLILATLSVLGKLGGVGDGMFRYGAGVRSWFALGLALSIPFLWRGAD